MKKKYLFLMKTGDFGGAERFQIDYFKFIDFDKYSVTFGVNTDVFSQHLKKNNLLVEMVVPPALDQGEGFFVRFWAYCKFLKSIKPHCVVFHQFFLRSFTLPEIIAAFLYTKGNIYMINHDCPPAFPEFKNKLHFGFLPGLGLHWKKQRLFQTLLGYFSKTTIAVSQASRDSLVKNYIFPPSKVKVVHHGIDVNENSPSRENRIRLRKELNIPDSDNVIVSTAMFHKEKCVGRLVEAFGIVAKERNDIQLILIGDGVELNEVKNTVSSFDDGVRRRIRFLGFQENIPGFLQLSDIFVLPSDSEGLPLACLEAMSCGLLTVVTDCGGPSEIVQDGENGFLVEKSCKGVVDGLKRALSLSREERQKMSHNARKSIVERFNLQKNIQCGLELLKINDGGKINADN
ncbi:glycosyltransferase family 4 protein [Candidatus Omnitrophota bacterium]